MESSATKLLHQKDMALHMESLFNSVENELSRRWAVGEVPEAFARRPTMDLCRMVKPWWSLYQESKAAASGANRTVWERNTALKAETLDTPGLVETLKIVRGAIDLKALRHYRPVQQGELAALGVLDLLITFYEKLAH